MSELRMEITGLCAFVPGNETAAPMTVLMVGDQPGSSPLEHHTPVLVFELRSLLHDPTGCGPATRAPDVTFWDPYWRPGDGPCPARMGLCFLDRQEVRVRGAGARPLAIEDGPVGGACIDPGNRHRFSWVAKLGDLDPAAARPAAKFFRTPCPEPELGARLVLDGGALRVKEMVGNQDSVLKVDFRTPDAAAGAGAGARARALAEVIELRLPLDDGEPLYLDFKALGGDPAPPPLVLRPRATGAGKRVRVWVKNMPLVDVLGRRPSSGKPDHHFAHLYSFADAPRAMPDRRIPHPEADCSGPASPTNPNCPPGRF